MGNQGHGVSGGGMPRIRAVTIAMKVLVIGATGGTGRHAVRLLLERGHEVSVWVRNPSAVGCDERSAEGPPRRSP